ncbi:hypothetical protein PAXRUDRAFT_685226 [Paxillus rubicundulus Ve08.2h10]|uniref:Uncharacterized protein n=1 Tax=Paxillus rubicundulus Ve08.2h10 TaxID=930991 RepID=A0A0D0E8F9_9AGAM|nr:hypothetical protein PAXRUDRAFT_685226 [Paxillus rubicundulus Ve08.2h10]
MTNINWGRRIHHLALFVPPILFPSLGCLALLIHCQTYYPYYNSNVVSGAHFLYRGRAIC